MSTILKGELKNIPWEDKPADCKDVVWRYSGNPIITKSAIDGANSIFNSAVVPYGDEFRGVFRCDNTRRTPKLYHGKSKDGINWEICSEPIKFIRENENIEEFVYGYDPRVCFMDGKYYVTWCNDFHGPTIGMAYTHDFETFYQMENIYVPNNRNGVLFPEKINGMYYMLNRPLEDPYGKIFISESPDLTYWGRHRFVMDKVDHTQWQDKKVGAGPIPIKTTEGWLMIYHGVMQACSAPTYSMGAAILDINEPWKVKYRTGAYIMAPHELYERVGDVTNVVFPCAALHDALTGRIAIYYGAADTVVGMAFTHVDELIKFIKANGL